MKRDLPLLVGVVLLMGPAALIPNLVLANALFSHSGDALALLVQPIPMWAAVIGLVAFPVTMAVAELPTYYGLILPRLQETWSNRWIALCVVVAWHATQHVALPLIFDVRFIAWRFFMSCRWHSLSLPPFSAEGACSVFDGYSWPLGHRRRLSGPRSLARHISIVRLDHVRRPDRSGPQVVMNVDNNRPWTVTRRLTRRSGVQIGLLEAASMSAS